MCPPCMMSVEDELEETDSAPGPVKDPRQESILYYITNSPRPGSSKRKCEEKRIVQPPSKSRRHSEDGGSIVIQDTLLNKLLERFSSLENKVDMITTVVTELKQEIILREVPVNTEEKIDIVISEILLIKGRLSSQEPTISDLSTQAALEGTSADMDNATIGAGHDLSTQIVLPKDVIPDWDDYVKK